MEFVRGSVMTLSRSGASSPLSILKDSIMSWVSLYRTPVATSKGRRINTESQLKKSWTVAPANALEAKEHTLEHVPDTFTCVTVVFLLSQDINHVMSFYTCETHFDLLLAS